MEMKSMLILMIAILATVYGVALPNLPKNPAGKGSTSCPPGGHLSPDRISCWYIRNKTMDFINAEMDCMGNLGGHLASVHSTFDNMGLTVAAREIAALYGNNFYIGLNRLTNDNVWSYTDESVVNYYDWNKDEPVNGDQRDCVTVDIAYGFWFAANCYDNHAYVCQTPSNMK
uniref:C-type lectin domain-containing protein n=1 Tax=Panagrolaimus sp. JU765 TaxID=591449 RepID=A0AC34RKP9_9BILA